MIECGTNINIIEQQTLIFQKWRHDNRLIFIVISTTNIYELLTKCFEVLRLQNMREKVNADAHVSLVANSVENTPRGKSFGFKFSPQTWT